jgi:hypothetical protein
MHNVEKIVEFDDFVWDVIDVEAHVLGAFQGSVQVKVFDVDAHELGAWGG